MDPTVEHLVRALDLQPHPEGGFYRETYRASGQTETANGLRPYATAIYYLLGTGQQSRLHRIVSDELWHFYQGDPLVVMQIDPKTGAVTETTLGADIATGQQFQHMVPGGHWFGAYLPEGSRYALVGCTVAPGFDFADFEMANRATLTTQFPQATPWIGRLT